MRVEELQERLGDKIEVEWKSFLLRAEPKTSTLEKFVRYTEKWQVPAEMEPRAEFTTPWQSGANPPVSSMPAQVAWKAAATFGSDARQRYHHALMQAYFVENRDISDFAELIDIAGSVDIDPVEFKQVLDDRHVELSKEVWAEYQDAMSNGITAVPTVVINGVLPIPGAQDTETYERLVERVLSRLAD